MYTILPLAVFMNHVCWLSCLYQLELEASSKKSDEFEELRGQFELKNQMLAEVYACH